MLEEALLHCGGEGSVGDMEDFCGSVAGGGKMCRVSCEAGAGGSAPVTDDGGYGAIEHAAFDEAGREGATEAATVELRLFTLLVGRV